MREYRPAAILFIDFKITKVTKGKEKKYFTKNRLNMFIFETDYLTGSSWFYLQRCGSYNHATPGTARKGLGLSPSGDYLAKWPKPEPGGGWVSRVRGKCYFTVCKIGFIAPCLTKIQTLKFGYYSYYLYSAMR